ncbi:Ankyrin repeats (3 copies) [Carpediemonas membranifera]|uniref:Ankyrin repeats (3 copies) n=1 Tax=Carpediemonas membranifera TaxID=201153 RepID=A0A8J6E6P7_9EUKA|nr:Ankyrin repeats (3 copies) [Carpediemonas membranifera]|eukprot:KAG9397342.1 Ankyrin repeats (3 copies) [Carpediemonas membranifera]
MSDTDESINLSIAEEEANEIERSELHEAALFNDTERCQSLIDEGADVNAVDSQGQTPLMNTLSGPTWSFQAAAVLATAPDADLTIADKNGDTALHHACDDDAFTLFKQLVDACPEALNMYNAVGDSPIHMCARQNAQNCLAFLVTECNVDIDMRTLGSKNTPLHLALLVGNVDLAVDLLARGSSWSSMNRTGQTVLHYAVTFATNTDIVKLLLRDYQADVDVTDAQGKTPLFLAARNAHCPAEMCELLISFGSDANKTNEEGETPLLWASGLAAIRVLVDRGDSKLTARAHNGTNILHGMAHFGDAEAVDFVLARLRTADRLGSGEGKLDLNGEAGPDRNTPLHTAVIGANQKVHAGEGYDGHVRVASLLIAEGADPTKTNAAGETAVELAARFWLGRMRRVLSSTDGMAGANEVIDNRKWWQKLLPCLM